MSEYEVNWLKGFPLINIWARAKKYLCKESKYSNFAVNSYINKIKLFL